MKLLKKMLLIHWHYFSYELIEFETINYLTGPNASGKSTLIDALQLLLLGDTTGHFFNKAANERSTRTLKGYLWGEVGDDGDVGSRYLRKGKFTSYIACEFHDDVKNIDTTLGVVFDCYDDGNHDYKFFTLDTPIPENHFIANETPMTIRELKIYLQKNYKKSQFEFADSNKTYRINMRAKLGSVGENFFSLLKKAVPFSPIADIESFIYEYVCNVKNHIDIYPMQENIRQYKRLELDSEQMINRIDHLEKITNQYTSYLDEKQRLIIQNYMVERAQLQSFQDDFKSLQSQLETNQDRIIEMETKQRQLNADIAILKKERDQLWTEKVESNLHKKLTKLKEEKDFLQGEIKKLQVEQDRIINNIRKIALLWDGPIDNFLSLCSEEEKNPIHAEMNVNNVEFTQLKTLALLTKEIIDPLLNINGSNLVHLNSIKLKEVREKVDEIQDKASEVNHQLNHNLKEIKSRIDILTDQVKNLSKGIKPYHEKLIDLKIEIESQLTKMYGKPIKVQILADILEIKNDHWKRAIEAYLHTQKFYLFVEPMYFVEALKIYDQLKFKKNFYDWGIVDTGKLETIQPKMKPGSLAEEIETENPYARLFINHVLGNLMKCDKVEDLRKYERSITADCMLYQNFVARQFNPNRWQNPYIGRNSIEEQIKLKEDELALLKSNLNYFETFLPSIKNLSRLQSMSENEIFMILLVVDKMKELPNLKERLEFVINEYGNLDLTWINKIDKQIKEVEEKISVFEEQVKGLSNQIYYLKKENERIANEKMPELKKEIKEQEDVIQRRFALDWIQETGEPRFLKEIASGKTGAVIKNNFYSQLARTKNQTEEKWKLLISLRSEYNKLFNMSYDINKEENTSFEQELIELKENKLPDYKKQIHDAKEKAYEQFKDDFLAKLKSNIDTVKRQIEDLNDALKESSFGNDKYRFTVRPKIEYRRYYDMITDSLLLDGYNLNSHLFRDKHKDAIDELFQKIIDVDTILGGDVSSEIENNIIKFTDYRTYLTFDLHVTDKDGNSQRLSKTLTKKSGGETQTPFYISILASFSQLYRVKQKGYSNTVRLVIFDEAFSKMDSQRIQESVTLLRRFGLQAILSAPPEKIGDIAPLVDRNLCVIRNGKNSTVKYFDAKKLIEEYGDELQTTST